MPVRTEAIMGTLVTINVVKPGAESAVERAFGWFHEIEDRCTRFKPQSELEPFQDFSIDAGGDLYLAGSNPHGDPWSVGIHHPRQDNQLIDCLHVSNQAVCTSGDYERRDHIIDTRTRDAIAPLTVASAT